MRRLWAYLKYVLRHKWYVGRECWRMGLYWQAFTHDLSKFGGYEYVSYAMTFYDSDGKSRYQPDLYFDYAWLMHQHRNPHHWQHWVLREDSGAVKVLPMPTKYWKEMVADWYGAGRALGRVAAEGDHYSEVRSWYLANRDRILLNSSTRMYVEHEIGVPLEDRIIDPAIAVANGKATWINSI